MTRSFLLSAASSPLISSNERNAGVYSIPKMLIHGQACSHDRGAFNLREIDFGLPYVRREGLAGCSRMSEFEKGETGHGSGCARDEGVSGCCEEI